MMYTAAKTFDDGGDAGYLANAAKLLASEAAVNTVDSRHPDVWGIRVHS